MGKFSRLGNDLYTGRRSIDFVGRTWLWYAISGRDHHRRGRSASTSGASTSASSSRAARVHASSMPASQVTQDNADKLRDAVAGTGIDAAPAGRS